MEVKVTFKINDEIKSEKYLMVTVKSRQEAVLKALEWSTGYGREEHCKWDDPEVLKREIISIEILED